MNYRSEKKEFKLYAVLSYIPFLCFVPLFKLNNKEIDQFTKHHIKQGFALLIIEIFALLFLIDYINKLFWSIILILCFIIAIIGIIFILADREFNIPYLNEIFKKYDI